MDIGHQYIGIDAEPAVAGRRVDVVLAPDAQAPAVARSLLEQHGGLLTRDVLVDAELLISEVVGNAVRHGAPEITPSRRASPRPAPRAGDDCPRPDGAVLDARSAHLPAQTDKAEKRVAAGLTTQIAVVARSSHESGSW